jgi:hypothetical protein
MQRIVLPLGLLTLLVGAARLLAEDARRLEADPASLAQWLRGKEAIAVSFVGPKTDLGSLRLSVKAAKFESPDFWLYPGEGGGTDGAHLIVEMKVTPETTQVLLDLEQELLPRGYLLDPQRSDVRAYKTDKKLRSEALRLVPDVSTAIEKAIKVKYPTAEIVPFRRGDPSNIPHKKVWDACDVLAGFNYQVPNTKIHGIVFIADTTGARKVWDGLFSVQANLELPLPRLGLIVNAYDRTTAIESGADRTPDGKAFLKAVEESLAPLQALEPDAAIERFPALPAVKPAK